MTKGPTQESLTFEEQQVAILQKRLQAEVNAHNSADNERIALEQSLAAKKQEIDRRFGKVVALQELLQEAGASLIPQVEQEEIEKAEAAAANGSGSEEEAKQVVEASNQ